MSLTEQRPLDVRLAAPRGFCAGVERAIKAVEDALARYGPPVFVRHEIVHNRHVVRRLAAMGAVFVDELEEADPGRPTIISAHGAPRAVFDHAREEDRLLIDATCPLVNKVHAQTRRYVANGAHVYLIGHAGHPEVVGTLGQVDRAAVSLVETPEAIAALPARDGDKAYVTQTTLSVDDTRAMIAALKSRFPDIAGPRREDICYATSNRQAAVKMAAAGCDVFIVIGDATSSNSKRLVDTADAAGARRALLISTEGDFPASLLDDAMTIGVSAGASAPEYLVEDFLARLAGHRRLRIETIAAAEENVIFKSPLSPA